MSRAASSSSAERLGASEGNATYRPSAEISANPESAVPPAPAGPAPRLTSLVVPAWRSRTKTSTTGSASSVERLVAADMKET